MSDCLFCEIVAGEVPAEKVIENAEVLSFRDINPAAPVHVLVIPKDHVADVNELTSTRPELLGQVFEVIASVTRQEGVAEGWRLVANTGADGGQSVDHLHFHVLGGRGMGWPPG